MIVCIYPYCAHGDNNLTEIIKCYKENEMYKKRAVVVGLLLLVLSGCSDGSVDEKNTSSDSNITKDSVEVSTDSYSLMMSYVEQIQPGYTEEQVVSIMGEPNYRKGSGIVYNYYYFDDYEVSIVYASDGLLLDITDNTTGEKKSVY